MALGDTIRNAINGATGASAISSAMTPKAPAAQTGDFVRSTAGHVTSGLDQAMRAQADKIHPVGKPATGADWDK